MAVQDDLVDGGHVCVPSGPCLPPRKVDAKKRMVAGSATDKRMVVGSATDASETSMASRGHARGTLEASTCFVALEKPVHGADM